MKTKAAASTVSATGVFIKALCVIFAVEALVMVVLPWIVPRGFPGVFQAFTDAFLLTAIAAPLLLWVIIRPILKERKVRQGTECQLSQTQTRLQLAADIQKKLLPKSAPALPGVDIAANLTSAESTSGDFYDFLSLPDGSIGIVIADVSGHGIDSALLVASASAFLRALSETLHDPGVILTHLNQFLAEQAQEGRFITMFFGRIDPNTLAFTYAAAGHRSFLFVGTEVKTLHANSYPLGVFPDITIPSSEVISLRPGQTLLFATDGLEESAAPDGEMFGSKRLIKLIQSRPNLSSQEMLESLFQEVRGYSSGSPQLDDMTAIVVKVLGIQNETVRSIPQRFQTRSAHGPVS